MRGHARMHVHMWRWGFICAIGATGKASLVCVCSLYASWPVHFPEENPLLLLLSPHSWDYKHTALHPAFYIASGQLSQKLYCVICSNLQNVLGQGKRKLFFLNDPCYNMYMTRERRSQRLVKTIGYCQGMSTLRTWHSANLLKRLLIYVVLVWNLNPSTFVTGTFGWKIPWSRIVLWHLQLSVCLPLLLWVLGASWYDA